jgi:tRNA A-37 threonylcarbamoyl transferase component Bud32
LSAQRDDPSDSDISDIPTLNVAAAHNNVLKDFLPPGYRIIMQLGKGAFGVTYLGCKDRYNCHAFKIVKLKNDYEDRMFVAEVEMQQKFAKYGLAPKVYKHSIVGPGRDGNVYGVIEMDRIAGTLDDLLKNEVPTELLDRIIVWVGDLIEAMCAHNLVHGDLHPGNIAYNLVVTGTEADPKIALQILPIDFGWSCCVDKDINCIPELELSQLLRGIGLSKFNKSNERYLIDKLLEIYRENYNPRLPNNSFAFDRENMKYVKMYTKMLPK